MSGEYMTLPQAARTVTIAGQRRTAAGKKHNHSKLTPMQRLRAVQERLARAGI